MVRYLGMSSNSVVGGNCIVLGGYKDNVLIFCIFFLDVAIIGTSNSS